MQDERVEAQTLPWVDRAIQWVLFVGAAIATIYAIRMAFYFLGGLYHNHGLFGFIYRNTGLWPNLLRKDEINFKLMNRNDLMVFLGIAFWCVGAFACWKESRGGYLLLCAREKAPDQAMKAVFCVLILQIILIVGFIVLGCGDNPRGVSWFYRPFRTRFPFLSPYASFIVYNVVMNAFGACFKIYVLRRLASDEFRRAHAARQSQNTLSIIQSACLLGFVNIVVGLSFGVIGLSHIGAHRITRYRIVAAVLIVLSLVLLGAGMRTLKLRSVSTLRHSSQALAIAGIFLLLVSGYSARADWLDRVDIPYGFLYNILFSVAFLVLAKTGLKIIATLTRSPERESPDPYC
ncbi:MAG: hypothetical protein GXP31_02215 [Kiritimatiellaeota bacterium]|nr:hypothetical protein [Kiritimatiellota bacterium]